MNPLANRLVHCVEDDTGVTAIEYGLLGALISVAIVATLASTGTALVAMYTSWSTAVSNAVQSAL